MMMVVHHCHVFLSHAILGCAKPKSGVPQHPCSKVEPSLMITAGLTESIGSMPPSLWLQSSVMRCDVIMLY